MTLFVSTSRLNSPGNTPSRSMSARRTTPQSLHAEQPGGSAMAADVRADTLAGGGATVSAAKAIPVRRRDRESA